MNLQNGIFENSIRINAPGSVNGNGLTFGHESYPAFNSIVRNNLFVNNATKGIFIQGSTNTDISVSNNIIMNNGNDSEHLNSDGVTTYFCVSNTQISNNEIIGNLRGVNMTNTSTNTTITNNKTTSNDLYEIDSDGLNSIVQDCYLPNAINIYNDAQETNLTEINNALLSAQIHVNYSYLHALSWLTDLKREVLQNL